MGNKPKPCAGGLRRVANPEELKGNIIKLAKEVGKDYNAMGNFYKDIADDVNSRFDTSGYCQNRPLPIGVNEKASGLMKDELDGRIMMEFVALRPKLYAFKTRSGSGDKKCKGVKKCVVKKMLNFDDCLLSGRHAFRKQLFFRNKLHKVHMVEVNKLALSRNNDKGVIQSDGVSTLAYGHKDVASHNGLNL